MGDTSSVAGGEENSKCWNVPCKQPPAPLAVRAGAGSDPVLGGAVMKDATEPSAQPHHAPCFLNRSISERNRGKGGQDGQVLHHFLPWRIQLPC